MPEVAARVPPFASASEKIRPAGRVLQEAHITQNWRGRPLIDHEVIVNLIGNTTTRASLTIQATLDQNTYPTGIVVTDCDLGAVNLTRAKFHGKDWNYAINPT